MITLLNPTTATVTAEIARLTAINEDAVVQLETYRKEEANRSQVKNAWNGLKMREEKIADLEALLK